LVKKESLKIIFIDNTKENETIGINNLLYFIHSTHSRFINA